MRVVLLGSTGYHPNELRHTACVMLPDQGILLDAGTGIFRAGEYLATAELDIFLTHAHLDHVVGLTFLFDVLYGRAVDRVTVYAEAAKLQAVREHLLNELLFPVPLPCDYRELPAQVPLRGGGTLRHFPLKHPGGAVGFRLDWPGHSLAYVTDTTAEPHADYIQAIQGVDLLIHECYFADEHREQAVLTGHSHTTPVAQVARAAAVGRLVLVHMNPLHNLADPIRLDVARRIFPATDLGYDRMELEF